MTMPRPNLNTSLEFFVSFALALLVLPLNYKATESCVIEQIINIHSKLEQILLQSW